MLERATPGKYRSCVQPQERGRGLAHELDCNPASGRLKPSVLRQVQPHEEWEGLITGE